MKRSVILQLLPIIALLCLAELARADIKVCNIGDEEIRYIYLNENLGIFGRGWLIEGWVALEPGDCETLNRTIDRQRAYFSIMTLYKNDESMLKYYPVGDIKSSSHWRDGWHGIQGVQEFFCAAYMGKPFKRSLTTLSSHKNCPNGWEQTLFNLELRTDGNSHYTLNVN